MVPRIAVESGSGWVTNHHPTHGLPSGYPSAAISPKMTCFELSGGNFHPQQPQALTGPPSTCMTRFNTSLRAENSLGQPPLQLLHPTSTISSKTTQLVLPGGNHLCPLTSTPTTCVDASLGVENSPSSPLIRPSHPSSMISSKTTRFASSGGNQPLSPTPARSTCFDMYSRVENYPGPSQTPSGLDRVVERGYKPIPTCSTRFDAYLCVENSATGSMSQNTSPLLKTKKTRFVSRGGNPHHHVRSSPISTQQDACLHILDFTQALPAMPCRVSMCGSLLPPSTTYTTCFDTSLRVENPCGAPQLPSDTIRTCKRGIYDLATPLTL